MKIVESESESSEHLKLLIEKLMILDEDTFIDSLSSVPDWHFEDIENLIPVVLLLNKIDSLLSNPAYFQNTAKLDQLLSFSLTLVRSAEVRSDYSSISELITLLDTPSWSTRKLLLQLLNLVISSYKLTTSLSTELESKLFAIISSNFSLNPWQASNSYLSTFTNFTDPDFYIVHDGAYIEESTFDQACSKVVAMSLFFPLNKVEKLVQILIDLNTGGEIYDELAHLVNEYDGSEISIEVFDFIGKTFSYLEHNSFAANDKFKFRPHEHMSKWARLVLRTLGQISKIPQLGENPKLVTKLLELVPITSRYMYNNSPDEYQYFALEMLKYLEQDDQIRKTPSVLSLTVQHLLSLLKRNLQILRENNAITVFIHLISKSIVGFNSPFNDPGARTGYRKLVKVSLKFFKILVDRWEEVYGGLDDMTQTIIETGFIEKLVEIFDNCLYEFFEDSLLIIFQIVQNSFSPEYARLINQIMKSLLRTLGPNFPSTVRQVDILARFLCGVPTESAEVFHMIEDSQVLKRMIHVVGTSSYKPTSGHISSNISESIQELVNLIPNCREQINQGILDLLNLLKVEACSQDFLNKISNTGMLLMSLLGNIPEILKKFIDSRGLELVFEVFRTKVRPKGLTNDMYKLNLFLKFVPDNAVGVILKKFLNEIDPVLDEMLAFIHFKAAGRQDDGEFFDNLILADLFIDAIKAVVNKWTGFSALSKEVIELMMKLAEVQRFIIQMQANEMDLKDQGSLDRFVVSPDFSVLENQELRSQKENWLFMCQLSVRRLFRGLVKVPSNRVKPESIIEYCLNIGRAMGQILAGSFKSIVFDANLTDKDFYFYCLLVSDVVKLIYSEQFQSTLCLLGFVIEDGQNVLAGFISNLQEHSKHVKAMPSCPFHLVNSMQILWSLSGKLLENFISEKYSNHNLAYHILKAFGYHSNKDFAKKMKELVVSSLKEVHYLDSGQFSLPFAKSVLAVLRVLTSRPKEASTVDPSCLSMLTSMGFSASVARQALIAVRRNSVETATEWIFAHPELLSMPAEETPEDLVFTEELFKQVIASVPVVPSLSQLIADCLSQMSVYQEGLSAELVSRLNAMLGQVAMMLVGYTGLADPESAVDCDVTWEQLEGILHVLLVVTHKNLFVFEGLRKMKFLAHGIGMLVETQRERLRDKWVAHLLALAEYLSRTMQEGCAEYVDLLCGLLQVHNSAGVFNAKALNLLVNLVNNLTGSLELVRRFVAKGGVRQLLLLRAPEDNSDAVSQNKVWVKILVKVLKDPAILSLGFQSKALTRLKRNMKLPELLKSFVKQMNRSCKILLESVKSVFSFKKSSGQLLVQPKAKIEPLSYESWDTVQELCDCLSVVFASDLARTKDFVLNTNNLLEFFSLVLEKVPLVIPLFIQTRFEVLCPMTQSRFTGNLIENLLNVIIPFRYQVCVKTMNYLASAGEGALPQATFEHWLHTCVRLLGFICLHSTQKYSEKVVKQEDLLQKQGLTIMIHNFVSLISSNSKEAWTDSVYSKCILRIVPEVLTQLLLIPCSEKESLCKCPVMIKELSFQSSKLIPVISNLFEFACIDSAPKVLMKITQSLFELLLRYHLNSVLLNGQDWEMLRSSELITYKTHFYEEQALPNPPALLADEDSPIAVDDSDEEALEVARQMDRTNERELIEEVQPASSGRMFSTSIFEETFARGNTLMRVGDEEMMSLILTNRNRGPMPAFETIPERSVKREYLEFKSEIEEFTQRCAETEDLVLEDPNSEANNAKTGPPGPSGNEGRPGMAPGAAWGQSRPRDSNLSQVSQSLSLSNPEIDPEFLMALPDDLRFEVLASISRHEENPAREMTGFMSDIGNADFVNSLDPDLRREVLASASEDIINLFPEDLAAEAYTLQERLRIRPRPAGRAPPQPRASAVTGFTIFESIESVQDLTDRIYTPELKTIQKLFEAFSRSSLCNKLFALTLLSLSAQKSNLHYFITILVSIITRPSSAREVQEEAVNVLMFLIKHNRVAKCLMLRDCYSDFEELVFLVETDYFSNSSNSLTVILKLINRVIKVSDAQKPLLSQPALSKLTHLLKLRSLSQKALAKLSNILNLLSQNPEIRLSLLSELENCLVQISREIESNLRLSHLNHVQKESQVFRLCEVIKNISGACSQIDFLWVPLADCIASLTQFAQEDLLIKKLLPLIQAFFICHAGQEHSRSLSYFSKTCSDQLNHLVKCNFDLLEHPLRILTGEFSFLLNFENKRHFFVNKLKEFKRDKAHGSLRLNVRRTEVFTDSFHQLKAKSPEEMQCKLRVQFANEDGIDAGGLAREWFGLLSREMFNANYALFIPSPNGATFQPNSMSHVNQDHLQFFKFVGRIVGKAISDGYTLDVYFTRSFYKHILGQEVSYQDMEDIDVNFYKNLKSLVDINLSENDLHEYYFSCEELEFGSLTVKELVPSGSSVKVTESNKLEYIKLVCHMKMTRNIQAQIEAFKAGFYEIISHQLISIFTSKELELLIAGLPTFDVEDLKKNTEYCNYTKDSVVIGWFWKILEEFTQEERAEFLQFVTGSSKVPIEGFKALPGMDGPQRFQIHKCFASKERLPTAHTCINQLDLPEYASEEELRNKLVLAIKEGNEGFGFA